AVYRLPPAGSLIVSPAEHEPEHQADTERDCQRRPRILLHIAADVVPDVAVILLEALRRGLDALADVFADIVELLASLGVGLAEHLLGLFDLLFDEVARPVERSLLGHPSPPVPKVGSYTLACHGEAADSRALPFRRRPVSRIATAAARPARRHRDGGGRRQGDVPRLPRGPRRGPRCFPGVHDAADVGSAAGDLRALPGHLLQTERHRHLRPRPPP